MTNTNVQMHPYKVHPGPIISNYNTEPQKQIHKPDIDDKDQQRKIAGAALLSALTATAVTGIVMSRRGGGRTNSNATSQLRNEISRQADVIRDLTHRNETLAQETENVRNRLNELLRNNERLDGLLDENAPTGEIRERLLNDLRAEVEKLLGYDPLVPPVTNRGGKQVFADAVDLPQRIGTNNRAHIRGLNIPEIRPDGSFEYQIPFTNEVRITKVESQPFEISKNTLTTLSEGYADSINWSNDKIVRDILQNFFDGHGQTLDGVKLIFKPVGNGKYKIRIEGKSTYTADKAILLGESSKRDDVHAAGNYGEGLKVSVLKLLRDKGATNVRIGSDDWDLIYKFAKGNVSEKRVLAYDLNRAAQRYNGNYLEFETNDRNLLDTFRTSINRFYHSENTNFRCPDFENDKFGIRLLRPRTLGAWNAINEGERGALYNAGQEFEFNGAFNGLEGATIFLKEKPPKEVLDPSRDRTSLNETDLVNIMEWLVKNMSKEEKIRFTSAMEPLWRAKSYSEQMPVDNMFQKFLRKIHYDNQAYSNVEAVHINFPSNYVAYSNASDDVVRMLEKNGYTVCNEYMSDMGMQTIRELLGDARAHNPIQPDADDVKRINIIKTALKKLAPELEGTEFSPEEIDTKIFLFDRNAISENHMNNNTLGEAIVDFGTSKGFWIDRNYFRESNFGDILETALHELSHKAGGDETQDFSYKLTDVNGIVLKQITENPKIKTELTLLRQLWEELQNKV